MKSLFSSILSIAVEIYLAQISIYQMTVDGKHRYNVRPGKTHESLVAFPTTHCDFPLDRRTSKGDYQDVVMVLPASNATR
jgi:hypothetical protein